MICQHSFFARFVHMNSLSVWHFMLHMAGKHDNIVDAVPSTARCMAGQEADSNSEKRNSILCGARCYLQLQKSLRLGS